MPDWAQYVRQNLRLSGLEVEREVEVIEDLAEQLEDAYAEALQRGLSSSQAEAAAKKHIADWTALANEVGRSRRGRESRMDALQNRAENRNIAKQGEFSLFTGLMQDMHYALRMLRKSPGFTTIAVLTLALGIGANTAIFSMVNWLVVQMPPVLHPQQVVTLATQSTESGYGNGFSYQNFEDIRNQTSRLFTDVAATDDFHMDGMSIGGHDEPIWTNYVTNNFFTVVGVKPALGTLIRPEPNRLAGDAPVLVLSYAFWQRHFGGDPGVIGKSATINGHPVTIVGVVPKGFHGITPLLDVQGYLPLGMAIVTSDVEKDFLGDRRASSLTVFARLRAGVTIGLAAPALNVIARRLSAQYPTVDKWRSLAAYPLGPLSPVSDPSSPRSIVLMGTLFLILAALVLFLACLNVANLLLVRASARQHEMGIRAAVGAARSRLVRQLLTESLLLAMLGCVAGIVLGLMSSRWIASINLRMAMPLVLDFRFDWHVFAYTFAATLVTAAVVGIAPAIRATQGCLTEVLHKSGRTTTGARQRTRAAFVIAQVGVSAMLLIVAGLFVRSLRAVQHSDLGFNPAGVLNFTVDAHEAGYDQSQGSNFLRDVLSRVRALPGIETSSLAATVPMGYHSLGRELKIEGYQSPRGETPSAGYNAVSPQYFETMRIPIVRGRTFLDSDRQDSQRVAIINEAMTEKYWRGENPIGTHFITTDDPNHPIEIVGEVKNSRTGQLYGPYDPYMYVPLAQGYEMPVTLQVRTALPLAGMSNEIMGAIHSLAPAMPVADTQTMTEALDTLNGLLLFQIGAGLAAALGILGLTLAVIGVYGVVSYGANQRTHEIGIRMALGAKPTQILTMIVGQGFLIIIGGVVLGALAAAGIGHLVGDFLVDVSPFDVATYFGAISVLAAVAILASYIPARRAMRVDPMVALRDE